MKTSKVSAEDSDIRLDRWFKRHLPNVTHGMLEKFLRKGDVRIEGKKAKSADRVQQGQVLEIRFNIENIKAPEKAIRHKV